MRTRWPARGIRVTSTAEMAKKIKAAKREKHAERLERRFEPRASTSSAIVYVAGALGALAMGAGAWEQFGSLVHEGGPAPLPYAPYILSAGTLLLALAVWLGTSGEPALRVGDAGVALEKGSGLRRLPWHGVLGVEWRDQAVRVTGKDEHGAPMNMVVRPANHGPAAAWIVKEARERIPRAVGVPADVVLPNALDFPGEQLRLEAPQVVGKHCAASGKVIAYEPDARVCSRCGRVYHKAHVPEACECGASLAELRS
jgi:hypothetical protein